MNQIFVTLMPVEHTRVLICVLLLISAFFVTGK